MKKILIVSLIAPAILGLAACGGAKTDGSLNTTNDVVSNASELNFSEDVNATDANTIDANATVPVDNTTANAH